MLTSAGRLPFKGIIHVAGINIFWRASEYSIRQSVLNSLRLAHESGFQSLAMPLIGAGSGGFDQDEAKTLILDELSRVDIPISVRVVIFDRRR